jgi:hypothetical protein
VKNGKTGTAFAGVAEVGVQIGELMKRPLVTEAKVAAK